MSIYAFSISMFNHIVWFNCEQGKTFIDVRWTLSKFSWKPSIYSTFIRAFESHPAEREHTVFLCFFVTAFWYSPSRWDILYLCVISSSNYAFSSTAFYLSNNVMPNIYYFSRARKQVHHIYILWSQTAEPKNIYHRYIWIYIGNLRNKFIKPW